MTFAFALHPRPPKDKILQSKEVLTALNHHEIGPLLAFIQDDNTSDLELHYVIDRLISDKWSYFWVYSISTIHEHFMNTDYSHYSTKILRKTCQFTRKLPQVSIHTEAYYVKDDTPLWTRFLGDLSQLDIDLNDHLFQNLKNFLEWEQYRVNNESKPLIAQILSPFYTSLKLNPKVPVAFLAETLKLLLHLDPKNPKGNFEFFVILQTACGESEQFSFLEKAVRLPSQEKVLFLEYVKNVKDSNNVTAILEAIVHQNNIKLDLPFFYDLCQILIDQNRMNEAFYICLHSFVLSKKSPESYSKLQGFFYYFGLEDQFNICKDKVADFKRKNYYISIPNLPSNLQYRLHHSSSWKKVNSSLLDLSSSVQAQIQFKYDHSKDDISIFYPEAQILVLECTNNSMSLTPGVLSTNNVQNDLSFSGTQLVFSENFLRDFKGFRKK